MKIRKLIRAMEKNRVKFFPSHVKLPLNKELIARLNTAEKFDLTDVAVEDIGTEEVKASLAAMEEMDLLHLPFESIYIEFNMVIGRTPPKEDDTPIRFRVGTLFKNIDNKDDFELECIVFFNDIRFPNYWYKAESVEDIRKPRSLDLIIHEMNFYKGDVDQVASNILGELLLVTSVECCQWLLVALHTKGIEFERVTSGKVDLTSRDTPINSYHRIIIGGKRIPTDEHGESVGTRKRMRLHLRRGHVRRQWYGYKRKRLKKVWIRPILVGYEEEGVITHEYEIVKPGKEM